VTFLLPDNKFPPNLFGGPDLDNLLKLTLDALQQTVFKDAKGKDSRVVSLMAMKSRVNGRGEPGAHIEILTVT
jgi:Holliday junction resolvase RusA-like endonuclease